MSEPRTYESLKYIFTADEIRGLGEQLAREAQNVFTLRQEKKELVQTYGSRIEEANGKVAILTDKINQGYELRDTECLIKLDTPRRGIKSIVRADHPNITVREDNMTAAEMQDSFTFTKEDLPPEDPESQPRKKGKVQ